ncbi:hypothetical protein GY45DRAFT_1321065 [Cubamyces sp. BRFM 1775]|nr:hypothetical protein GY45DRAFT_1321065 [Cubamyces sp. BRFM 1775]
MARGNRGGNRGRGFRGNNNSSGGRGRGGGGRGRGRGRGGPAYQDEFDFPIQQWPSNYPPSIDNPRPTGGFRGRGRGRGGHTPGLGSQPARGSHFSSPSRGRGRGEAPDTNQRTYGLGRDLATKLKAGAPLSKVLYEDRPFLRPVKFVRSVNNPTLFRQEEEILQPVVEAAVDGDEASHVPTADAVSRIFNPNLSEDEEELEEVDFADIGRLQAEVDAAAANLKAESTATQVTAVEESASFFIDTTPANILQNNGDIRTTLDRSQGALGEVDDDDEVIVYVAPHPRRDRATPAPQSSSPSVAPIPSTSIITGLAIGSPMPNEVVDVPSHTAAVTLELGTLYPEVSSSPQETFSAPDPSELPPPPSFDNVSFAFEKTTVKKQTRRLRPVGVGTPRSLLKRSRQPRRKSLRGFSAYGAMHEEAQLHEIDPRRDEQRRGDSDVNWGDSDSDDDVEELSTGLGDMDIDGNISLSAMKAFVHSMSAEGSRHVTMDDVADAERMRAEDAEKQVRGAESADEESNDGGLESREPAASDEEESEGTESEDEDADGDEEVEAIMRAAEAELVGESDGDGDADAATAKEGERHDADEDGSEDEESTPRRGFQADLQKLRSNAGKGKGKAKAVSWSSDDSSDEAMSVQMTWASEDEDYYDHIEDILEAHQDLLLSHDRKSKKKLFSAIRDGQFDDDMFAGMMAPTKRGKNKDVPPELQEQWEKDRQKKAENKRKRALERMQLAADPLAQHKGGKKGLKAMLAAARADADADLPNRITDLVSLEQQIRRFLADIGGKNTMALPPADKETRKKVHELAGAFNLKSQSKGSGQNRYTTLTKTTKSGVGINEKKIRRILKQATNGAWEPSGGGYGRSKAVSLAKHREGEVVGKEAPKIGESNIGFKMLAAMGWADGDRIGLSGGLDVPLAAVMKKTKLGLGASLQ